MSRGKDEREKLDGKGSTTSTAIAFPSALALVLFPLPLSGHAGFNFHRSDGIETTL